MSNGFDNLDVIIIGGGLAGLTTTALLAYAGKEVTLFEPSSRETKISYPPSLQYQDLLANDK